MERRPNFLPRTTRRVAIIAMLGLLLAALPTPASASAIHSHMQTKVRTEASLGPVWARFLAGGSSLWAVVKPPKIPAGLRLATSNGLLAETPFVKYLDWRRILNPTRFDLYHPILGPQLALLPTTSASTPVAQTVVPPATVNPQPQTVVPEPHTFVIGLFLMSAGFGWRWRLRQTETPLGDRSDG
jgi:hypothetical protein